MPTTNHIKRSNWIAIVIVVLVLGAVVVVAKTSRQPLSDPQFAAKAAQGSIAEVELGQLAAHKGQTKTVRAFGQRMATDHANSKAKLEKIAAQQNISLPEDLEKDAKQNYEKLSKLSGKDFDRAYAQDMVKDHKKDVAEFQKEGREKRSHPLVRGKYTSYFAGPPKTGPRNEGSFRQERYRHPQSPQVGIDSFAHTSPTAKPNPCGDFSGLIGVQQWPRTKS